MSNPHPPEPSTQSTAAAAAHEEWTTVTRTDKKRVMRRRRRTNSNHRPKMVVAHPMATLDAPVTDSHALLEILSICQQQLVHTDFFQHCLRLLQNVQTPPIMNNEDKKEEENAIEPKRIYWQEIVCLGIGNFAKTQFRDVSASLWQLAWVLLLRRQLMEQPQKKQIRTRFYDPVSTPWECEFLNTHLNVETPPNSRDTNDHDHDDNNQQPQADDDDSDSSLYYSFERPTLVIMPHCPLFLYERVLAGNPSLPPSMTTTTTTSRNNNHNNLGDAWQNDLDPPPIWISSSSLSSSSSSPSSCFAILGNSLLAYGQGLQPLPCPIPCLEEARPHVYEQAVSCSPKDLDHMPGNFEGAFHDTYLSYLTTNSTASTSTTTTTTTSSS